MMREREAWDRQLCTNVAQLAVDLDKVIQDIDLKVDLWDGAGFLLNIEDVFAHQASMIVRLTRICEGLNKTIKTIELENTTPRFSTQSIKAVDLIWAS